MWRKDITHPRLTHIKGSAKIKALVEAVESGDPDVFASAPTTHATDVAVGSRLSLDGIAYLRSWMIDGKTSTLRTNALSTVAKLPGRANAELVVRVLEEDERVRRLCLASEISRLTRVEWQHALRIADDIPSAPKPRKFAAKLAKEAVDPHDTESRWCGSYMLSQLVSVIGR